MPNKWIQEVKSVQEELGCSYREAMTEASRRRKGVGTPSVEHPTDPQGQWDFDLEGGLSWEEFKGHVKGFFTALVKNRDNFKPSMRDMLAKIGDKMISQIQVGRRPLGAKFSKVVSIFGSKNVPHDKLFHLWTILTIEGQKYTLEKNQDINLIPFKQTPTDEIINLQTPQGLTINKMLDNIIRNVGAQRVFDYQATNWNCQRFIIDLLSSSGIPITEEAKKFILQDVSQLMPKWTERLAYGLTSLKNRLDMAIEGYGQFDDDFETETDTIMEDPRIYQERVLADFGIVPQPAPLPHIPLAQAIPNWAQLGADAQAFLQDMLG